MDWHTEGIGAAIALAKERGTIFAVVVKSPAEAEQEETALLEEALQNPEVVACLSSMVCIQVDAGSTTCAQFAAIYPVLVVPSVYFIDSATGVDLEITGGRVTTAGLLASVQRAQQRKEQPDVPAPAPAAAPAPETSPAPTAVSLTAASAPTPAGVLPAPSSTSTVDVPASTSSTSSSTPLEERVARAKQLVVQRQEEREQEGKEKEKNEEMERRKLGQVLQEREREKEEKEVRKAALEKKKDKEEEKKAREAVKAAIEQDRQARKAKYDQEKVEVDKKRAEKENENLAAAAAAAEVTAAERASIARIQFRLPDGRNMTKQFPADSPLAELYTSVTSDMDTGFTSFTLSTTFPRRQLDLEDRSTSLRQLQMAPSATVLVIPKASAVSTLGGGDLTSLLWLLLSPLTMLWTFLNSLFAGQGSSQPRGQPPRSGGMGRLRRTEADDDETNTYNGNSTQQQ